MAVRERVGRGGAGGAVGPGPEGLNARAYTRSCWQEGAMEESKQGVVQT